MANEPIQEVDSIDDITDAIMQLLNQFSGFYSAGTVSFSTIPADGGFAMFPSSGAIVEREKFYITGFHRKDCYYPFLVLYKAAHLSPERRKAVRMMLENLGRWMEMQTIEVGEHSYKLADYPVLSFNRRIRFIERLTPPYLESVDENKCENWVLQLRVQYRSEYQMQ